MKKYAGAHLFNGTELLGPNHVLIIDDKGIIESIVTKDAAGDGIQILDGIISPGFINCHCHLELSHLKGAIKKQTGLVDFILSILSQRFADDAVVSEAMKLAEDEMIRNGIVAVGDISNQLISLNQKKENKLYYHNFIEASGFSPAIAQSRFEAAFQIYQQFQAVFPKNTSLVPHAPYSVSAELFRLINEIGIQPISSIHNQETTDENEFFLTGKGAFNRLYETLGIDIKSFFKPSGKNSLPSIEPLISNAQKLFLVHDTFTTEHDIDFINASNSISPIICICINANLYIENTIPPIDLFLKKNCEIVLGTDSLASNDNLSILSEIESLQHYFPHIPLSTVLQWATLNGAKALNIDDKYGSFEKGKQPGINLIKDNKVTVIHH